MTAFPTAKDDFLDITAVETFIDGVLYPEMRLRLKMGNMRTLIKATALEFEAVKRSLSSNIIRNNRKTIKNNVENRSYLQPSSPVSTATGKSSE